MAGAGVRPLNNHPTHGNLELDWNNRNYLRQVAGGFYGYNHQGLRFEKQQEDKTTTYFMDGAKIILERIVDKSSTTRVRYFYDAEGIIGMNYKGVDYHFIRDVLGNICKVYQADTLVGEYYYDARGNVLERVASTSVQHLEAFSFNPWRWKGYYRDSETGFYIISTTEGSRYYDPMLFQFVSPLHPENAALNASVIGGLDLYGITAQFGAITSEANSSVF